MFKGSKNVEPEAHTSIIASVGGRSNAYTTEDETVFWQTFPAQYLPMVLWMEADRMATLRIDEAAFTREREVVKEERRMRIENQPYGRLNEIIFDQAFTTHPYKHPTIGSMADLEAASVEDVREFHNTFYVPENATVAIVGDFDVAQTVQLVTNTSPGCRRRSVRCRATFRRSRRRRRRSARSSTEAWPLPAVVVALSRDLRRTSGLVSAAHDGEDSVRRQERPHPARADLQQAPRADGVRQRQHHRGPESVLRRRRAAAGADAARRRARR